MRRLFVLLVGLLLVTAAAPGHAQSERVKTIPIVSVYSQIRVSPDGRTVALFEQGALHDNEVFPELLPVRLLDVVTGEIVHELTGSTDYANEAAFSSDGSRLMTYHDNGDMLVWDVASGEIIRRIVAFPVNNGRSVFYPDSPLLIMNCNPTFRQLCEWDTDSGHMLRVLRPAYTTRAEFSAQFDGGSPPSYVAHTLSSDGSTIAAATSYGAIELIDVATGNVSALKAPLELPMFNINSLAFLAGDEQIIFYDQDTENVHVIEVRSGRELVAFPAGYAGYIQFALAPDQDRFAWLAGRGSDVTFNVSSISGQSESIGVPLPLPEGVSAPTRVINMVFSPDGNTVIAGGFANTTGAPDNVLFMIDVSP